MNNSLFKMLEIQFDKDFAMNFTKSNDGKTIKLFMLLKLFVNRGVGVITTTQIHLARPELRFCTVSNHARGVSEFAMVRSSDSSPG